MDAELEAVVLQISQAKYPEELFGFEDVVLPPDFLHRYVQKRSDALKAKLNPTTYFELDDKVAAQEALEQLKRLEAAALRQIDSYVYGIQGFNSRRPAHASRSFTIGAYECFVGGRSGTGPGVTLFEGYLEQRGVPIGEVTIKLADTPAENHLVVNEDKIIAILHDAPGLEWKHLPVALGRFETDDRVGVIFRKVSGITLSQTRRLKTHRSGVEQKHMVWILDRCLKCLSFVHSQGVLHGDLTPDNILIQPTTHNTVVMNWSAAVHRPAITGERVQACSESFCAPETKAHGKIGPWSDLYSLGKNMIWLLGGNPEVSQVPTNVEKPLRDLLRLMVRDDPYERPKNAQELRGELTRVKDGLWPRRFLHFDISQ